MEYPKMMLCLKMNFRKLNLKPKNDKKNDEEMMIVQFM